MVYLSRLQAALDLLPELSLCSLAIALQLTGLVSPSVEVTARALWVAQSSYRVAKELQVARSLSLLLLMCL